MITDANGHSLTSEPAKEEEKQKLPPGTELQPTPLVKSGLLDYNLMRHIVEMVMVEGAIEQMKHMQQAQKMVVPPPELDMLIQQYEIHRQNIQVMIEEKNVRMAKFDEARAAEWKAAKAAEQPEESGAGEPGKDLP